VIRETCHVCFWSHTCAGQASDQRLAALAGETLPPGSCLDQDQGVQGVVLPGITLFQAKQTPRGGELTPPEQATTRRLASSSIRMEHAHGGVKRERMVQDNIRLSKDGLRDTMMDTCCGLHTFRLQCRPWPYAS
jgi:hypothetical protein